MNSGHRNLRALISPIRKAHLAQLMRRSAHLTDENYFFTTEPVKRTISGEIARDGVLNLPYRSDFELHDGDGIYSVDLQDVVSGNFDPTIVWISKEQPIILHPFAWNALDIGFSMDGNIRQLQALRHWYLEWFQERLFVDAPALCGTVHRISGPIKYGQTWTISIDLGTAPEAAISELLEVLISCGVHEIEFRAKIGALHEHQ